MTRVFRNREEAEKLAIEVQTLATIARHPSKPSLAVQSQIADMLARLSGGIRAHVDLESQLAEALEDVQWGGRNERGHVVCPECDRIPEDGHTDKCVVSLALRAFRGEGERG